LQVLLSEDSSLVTDDSVYVNEANATVINWRRDRVPEFAEHLSRFLIVEACLLQYWQLVALHARLGEINEGADLRRVQMDTIAGLQEWRQSAIAYGSAAEVSERLLADLRVERLHAGLLESLNQLQQMQMAEDSRRAMSRANAYAFATVLATVVLGLPAINEALRIVREVRPGTVSGSIAAPLRPFAHHGFAGAWTLYLCLVALVAGLAIAMATMPRRRTFNLRRSPGSLPGFRWPLGTVQIVRESPSDDESTTDERYPHSEFGA